MLDAFTFDPSSVVIAFFGLPHWAQVTLLAMAAALVVMNSILSAALWSRRKARLKTRDLTAELADVKARLDSEMRWRLADEHYRASVSQARALAVAGDTP